jgi:hypothetical protein
MLASGSPDCGAVLARPAAGETFPLIQVKAQLANARYLVKLGEWSFE